eukprot:gene1562-3017_t
MSYSQKRIEILLASLYWCWLLFASVASAFYMGRFVQTPRIILKSLINRRMVNPYSAINEVLARSYSPMRPRPQITWNETRSDLITSFGFSHTQMEKYDQVDSDDLLNIYETLQLSRSFENACNQAYKRGNIRGFLHLDSGQESVSAIIQDQIHKDDIKYSYYREHSHAIASGISPDKIMAELFGKETGVCKGAGGSMHIYDKEVNFQGGWALVAEHLPYATGAARSILLDRELYPDKYKDDTRITVVFLGDGAAQNGRMAECLNAAAIGNLPILFIIVDNGRAINTLTSDVAANINVFEAGRHYGIPGILADGQDVLHTLRTARAVIDYVRHTGPAILQVHTYRFFGHSSADPELEEGRKEERSWVRAKADPIVILEDYMKTNHMVSDDTLLNIKNMVQDKVNAAVAFAESSTPAAATLAVELQYPDAPSTDYNTREPNSFMEKGISLRKIDFNMRMKLEQHILKLQDASRNGNIAICDAVNLAILEEMLRDPTVIMHAEDLRTGSSYNIPKLCQQCFGSLCAADEIISEGHFIGKAIGEAMNGYRPIVELMNMNFGVYGVAEISSAGNTYSTSGGQFALPLTIIGAGGTAPEQGLGATHSQPFHTYIMGIPGIKVCTASSPAAAYGLTKSMIRDNGPGMLFLPVKRMKETIGSCSSGGVGELDLGKCLPLNKAALIHKASDVSMQNGNGVTIISYLHGIKECQTVIDMIANDHDISIGIDLIELRSLKPIDIETISTSIQRTHKVLILDESTFSGGIGATISAVISESFYFDLDMPVKRFCMDDVPVPYAPSMERLIVKRAVDIFDYLVELFKK